MVFCPPNYDQDCVNVFIEVSYRGGEQLAAENLSAIHFVPHVLVRDMENFNGQFRN